MGIEELLIASGVILLIIVLARRRRLQKRLVENQESLSGLRADALDPEQVAQILAKAPRLKGDGSFSYKTVETIPHSKNFDEIRISRRLYFVEPTEIEVLLIPEPGNLERKLAVAVTIDSKLLGYVPAKEAIEVHKYLLAHSVGVRANARIYLGSRPDYNGVMLDIAKPLKLESKRKRAL
jgi:hypothetical protein